MKNLAISYLRFSSSKQRKGVSYSRQIQATEEYCRANGLTLISRLEDLGVSGWTGANLDDTAALGGFLNQVNVGKIPQGATLIIENLDRLSRARITKAVNLLTGILEKDIDIVTTMDGARYTKDSNTMELIVAVTILARGNEESQTKSKRVKDAWVRKRTAIQRGEFVLMTQHPNWLTIENGRYVPDRDAAKTVKTIFEMYGGGKGSHVIAKELNRLGVKPFARAKKSSFTFSGIERLLKSEAVIGTCNVVDPPKKDYWPRVISDALWYKVQALRQQNSNYKGTRNDVKRVNFLGGLIFCAKCGGSMVRYSCTGKNDQRYHYLTCKNAKYGDHSLDLVPYEEIQKSFIAGIHYNGFLQPFLRLKTETVVEDKTPELRGRLIELNKKISRVADAIVESDSPDLVKRIKNLENEKKELQVKLKEETNRVNAASSANAAYLALVKDLDKKIEEDAFRASLRDFLRGVVAKVDVGRDEERRPFYTVQFKESKDVVTVVHSDPRKPDKTFRVSVNGTWQLDLAEFA